MARLANGRAISAVIEQSLDNCLLVRFNHGSKIFRGVLFDEKHSVVSRSSLHDRDGESSSGKISTSSQNSNANGGQTSSRISTRQNPSPNVRLYRNTSTTRRNINSSNKLQVFTEFDVEESTDVDAGSGSIGSRIESDVQNIDGSSSLVSKDCTVSHRSTRNKSRPQTSTKHNTSNKNTSLNQKAVRTQNGSKTVKGKGKVIDVVGMNSNLRSKTNSKSRQVVSKNSKVIQSSKDHQLKSQSLKKTEVGSTKLSPHKEILIPKKTSRKISPSQDSMVIDRKRKMDSGTQTAHLSLCKPAKKHLLCDKTEISTQANIKLDIVTSEKIDIPILELETQGNIEQNVNTKQEPVAVSGCDKQAVIVLDDKSADTKLDLESNTGQDISTASSLLPCDQQQSAVAVVSETQLNDSGDQNDSVIEDNNMKQDHDTVSTISDKQNNSPSVTPVKRSARISEKRSRQQFGDEMFDERLWITTPTKSQKRILGTGNINTVKKSIAVDGTDNITTKPGTLVQCTSAESTGSHSVIKVNNNSSRRIGARIKFTPLRTRISTSPKMQRCTDTKLKHCQVSVGDIVWGKVHGHPWWPARVLAVSGNALGTEDINRDAHVAWFGSNTSSIMPSQGLAAFLPNFKKRFRRNKRGPYRTAVHEAQAAAKLVNKQDPECELQ